MLIIRNNIVIAHMKKCGGTSVCMGIIDKFQAEDIDYWGYTPEGERKSALSRRRKGLWKHSPVADIVRKNPQKKNDLQIYLISVRPWWERVASFYFHAKRYNSSNSKKYAWIKEMSFSEFIRSERIKEIEHLDQFCQDDQGELLVNNFVEFNKLSTWYETFMSQFGFSNISIPEYNRSSDTDPARYRELYSAEDFAYLEQKFSGETQLVNSLQPAEDGLLTLR